MKSYCSQCCINILMLVGTLSVAGSPQPFKPVSDEPSIITRMPHMINQQYRYINNNSQIMRHLIRYVTDTSYAIAY